MLRFKPSPTWTMDEKERNNHPGPGERGRRVYRFALIATLALLFALGLDFLTRHAALMATTKPKKLVENASSLSDWKCRSRVDEIDDVTAGGSMNIERSFCQPETVLLGWGDAVGQLCNRMAILAATLSRMKQDKLMGNFLGLSHQFTEVARVLDSKLLSSSTRGILFECKPCRLRFQDEATYEPGERFDEWRWDCGLRWNLQQPHSFARCEQVLVAGRLYRVKQIFKVKAFYDPDVLWWKDRAKYVGFLPEHVEVIQPKPHLKKIVSSAYRQFVASSPGVKIVAVHRRHMDGYCYDWVHDKRAHQCAPSKEFDMLHANLFETLSALGGGPERPRDPMKWTQEFRDELEEINPLLSGCNYTLSKVQQQHLVKQWPELKTAKIVVILATDRQDAKGDKVMLETSWASKIVLSTSLEDPQCYSERRYHNMLAEMLLLSMADFHVENSMSSCGDIVAHWRVGNGQRAGTSFPNACYDDFYAKKTSIPKISIYSRIVEFIQTMLTDALSCS